MPTPADRLSDREPAPDAGSGGDEASETEASEEEREARGEEEPDEDIVHAETPVPSRAELRAALDWAFDGEDIREELLDAFALHAERVLEANRRINLTSIVEPRDVAAKHYLDSWRLTRYMSLLGKSIVDVGTGAGFPAIPLALAEPNAKFILIESRRKRAELLGEWIDELGLKNAQVEAARGEDYLAYHRHDVVVMRALSSVRENVRLLRKVRHSHKDLVMYKGPSWSREVRAAEREAERLGFTFDTVWEHELPEEMGKRCILVYRAPGSQGL